MNSRTIHFLPAFILIFILVATILLYSGFLPARADGIDYEEQREGTGSGEQETAGALGEVALVLGAPAVLAYVGYKLALPRLARAGIRPPVSPRTALRMHAATSLALGLLAATHGLLLLGEAGPLEIVLGGVLVLTLASGATLYLLLGRRGARAARAVHAQRLLALTLLLLALLHALIRG